MVDHLGLSRALGDALTADAADAALAVCRACVTWLPMTGASITVMGGAQGQESVCATDPAAARIDELQFNLGEGPCVQAFATGRAVLVSDIAAPGEDRWPVFAAAAAETGARGMYVFPLQAGSSRLGVLDCYRDAPGSLDDRELAGALLAADAALWALLDHLDERAVAGDREQYEYDGSALVRAEVHQATGMLMAQAGLTAPVALAALRAAAFTEGRGIAAVAADVVSRHRRLAPDGSWRTVPDAPAGGGRPPPRPTHEHPDDDEREDREDREDP